MTPDVFMSAVAIIYIHVLRAVKLKFLPCLSMSDITLLSKFLFSVELCHSLLPNARLAPRCLNICLVHTTQVPLYTVIVVIVKLTINLCYY